LSTGIQIDTGVRFPRCDARDGRVTPALGMVDAASRIE